MNRAGSSSGGKFSRWKRDGRTVGYIHKRIGIEERKIHGTIPSIEMEDGKEQIKNRRYNCVEDNCPICSLEKFADKMIEDKTVDAEELLLDGGDRDSRFTFEEAAGRSKNWRKKIYARSEFLFVWIPTENRSDDNPAEIVTATQGLAMAIKRMIGSAIDDYGEVKGDPLKTPYPIKLTFDDRESNPSHKYRAERFDSKLAPFDEDIEEIMTADEDDLGLNLKSLTQPGDPFKMLDSIESTWACREISFEEFKEFAGYGDKKRGSKRDDERRSRSRGRDEEPEEKGEDLQICPECKTEVEAGRKFCPECGEKLKGSSKKMSSKKESNKQAVYCDECKKDVKPNKYGKCPDCMSRLDVPF